jgi:hypothetical protein
MKDKNIISRKAAEGAKKDSLVKKMKNKKLSRPSSAVALLRRVDKEAPFDRLTALSKVEGQKTQNIEKNLTHPP